MTPLADRELAQAFNKLAEIITLAEREIGAATGEPAAKRSRWINQHNYAMSAFNATRRHYVSVNNPDTRVPLDGFIAMLDSLVLAGVTGEKFAEAVQARRRRVL